ncbi:MAG: ABC transporter permease [Actinobacteria bacterium]|jgi:Cu-processing system permease protein|nr:ABC transporter permease [Actinomycetota bacterium]MBT3687072.1 ABC transporter permease [Actinomycetota bacterium]MBT4037501.1 ABC transporter permease [Actinomycetota bacterium]MBT4279801.1 ABC transporter permease [Actinomycetota bacterium]MBT4342652.1 ABC transporter permease [Actinomycetota bacterium]
MTAVANSLHAAPRAFELRLLSVIARKVIREASRDRWFWLYCAGFTALAGAITITAVPDHNLIGSGGFGRTAASLVALVQLVVPLMALTLGARYLAGERDSGTLVFLLCHPVSRTEVLLGTYVGLAGSMFAAVATGFGAAGLFSALRSAPTDPVLLVRLAALSWLLSLAMLGLGLLISSTVRSASTALGTALFVWLAVVFLGDLGIMGTVVATRLPVGALFATVMVNPVEAFRLASVVALDGSLDALGPAGTYAVDRFGDGIADIALGVMATWTIAAVGAAVLAFRRGDQT